MRLDFERDNLYVPLTEVDRKVGEILIRKEGEYKSKLNKKDDVILEYVTFINALREKIGTHVTISLIRPHMKNSEPWFTLGETTKIMSKGIRLYVGDEVILPDGSLGVIRKYTQIGSVGNAPTSTVYMVVTNHQTYNIATDGEVIPEYDNRSVNGDDLTLSQICQMYVDGQEVARGRKGGAGFIVSVTKK